MAQQAEEEAREGSHLDRIARANEFYVAVLVEAEQERNVAPEAVEERVRKLEEARTWTEQLEPPQ